MPRKGGSRSMRTTSSQDATWNPNHPGIRQVVEEFNGEINPPLKTQPKYPPQKKNPQPRTAPPKPRVHRSLAQIKIPQVTLQAYQLAGSSTTNSPLRKTARVTPRERSPAPTKSSRYPICTPSRIKIFHAAPRSPSSPRLGVPRGTSKFHQLQVPHPRNQSLPRSLCPVRLIGSSP